MTKKNKVIVKYKEYTRIHSFFSISYNLNNKFKLANNSLNPIKSLMFCEAPMKISLSYHKTFILFKFYANVKHYDKHLFVVKSHTMISRSMF